MTSIFRDLVRKALVYGLGSSLNSLASFLLIPFFIHRLTSAEYGRFALAEMMINLMYILLGLGMNVALLSRYQRLEPDERTRLIGSVFALLLITTLGIEGVYLACVWLFGDRVFPSLGHEPLLLVAAITSVEVVWLLFGTVFRAQGAAWRFITGSAVQVMVSLVATIVLIVTRGYREEGILYGRLIGDGALVLFLSPQLVRYRPRLQLGPALALLRIGLPLIPATFGSTWVLMSPRYLIDWFGGNGDVGVFAMSTKIASVMSVGFVQPFATAWIVALFKVHERPDARRIYARTLTYYILVGAAMSLALGLAAPTIVHVLDRNTFPLSVHIIAAMALCYVMSGLMHPLILGPYLKERTTAVLPPFLLSTVLIVAIGIPATQLWGAFGTSLALIAVYLVQSVTLGWVSHRLYPVGYEWGRIAKVIAAAAVAFAAARLAGWAAPAMFLALLVGLLAVLRFPHPDELDALRSWRRA